MEGDQKAADKPLEAVVLTHNLGILQELLDWGVDWVCQQLAGSQGLLERIMEIMHKKVLPVKVEKDQ